MTMDSQSALPPAQDTRVGFVHIPKTAGRSINTLLRAGLRETVRIVSIFDIINFGDFLTGLPILSGHVPAFVLEGEPTPRRLFTVLRDPVERAISNYRFIVNTEEHYAHDYVIQKGLSLADCFDHPVLRVELVNFQTKMLGWSSQSRMDWPARTAAQFELCSSQYNEFQFQSATEATLRSAICRVEGMGVALTDNSDSIVELCRDWLGFTPHLLPHENRGIGETYEATDAEVDIIREHNLLDIALVDFVRERIRRRHIQPFEASIAASEA